MGKTNAPQHLSFYIALGAGVLVVAAMLPVAPGLALLTGASVFFLVYLALIWRTVGKLSPAYLHVHAAEDDTPAPFILASMVGAVAVSALSLFLVLGELRSTQVLILGASSVVLGWFAVHTMWAMHYAFEYYQDVESIPAKRSARRPRRGLEFAGSEEPDGTTFVYFAYVIGMTAQTSDTVVTSNAMRRLVTMHSVFAFFFNTVIVAAAVNIAVTLAH